jgi:hypothetical protein
MEPRNEKEHGCCNLSGSNERSGDEDSTKETRSTSITEGQSPDLRGAQEKKGEAVYSIACVIQCACGALNISDNSRVVFAGLNQMTIEIDCAKCKKRIAAIPRQKTEAPRIIVPGQKLDVRGGLHV